VISAVNTVLAGPVIMTGATLFAAAPSQAMDKSPPRMATRTGELSVRVASWEVLADPVRGFPDKWHGISDQDIVGLNIPNGIPLVYELDDNLKPIRHYYLGDAEAAAKAAAALTSHGKA
jgi:hypothetical protein